MYVDPGSQPHALVIEPDAARVNGYTPELWKKRGAVDVRTAMEWFRDWLQVVLAPGDRLVCHNLGFDRGFLMEAERVTGVELPGRYAWRCSMLELARQMDRGILAPGPASLDRLGDLSGFWKKEGGRDEKHDALQDARACLHGWEWMAEATDARHAEFGRLMWERIEKKGGDYCWQPESEDILPLAEKAGLCRRVKYDPDLHGEDMEADPGDVIWFWGKEGKV